MVNSGKNINKIVISFLYSAVFVAGIIFVSGNSLNAQGKSCNTTCDLYYDCFSIAYLQSSEGKAPGAKSKLQREKQNIIKKCVKECVSKQSQQANINQCYKTRNPTIPVCQAFYSCAVKFYKN